MNPQQEIEQYCRRYKIMGMAPRIDELVKKAENEQLSYVNFLHHLFEQEALHREKQAKERLLKTAQLPSKSILISMSSGKRAGSANKKQIH
jgi:DNA replication protein DnaC